jgi:hypothetical protein
MAIKDYMARLKESYVKFMDKENELHNTSHGNPDEHPMNQHGEVEQDVHEELEDKTEQDEPPTTQPENQSGSRTVAASKAVSTRQAKYGETKVKDSTEKQMTDSGAKLRQQKMEKKGKEGRAN